MRNASRFPQTSLDAKEPALSKNIGRVEQGVVQGLEKDVGQVMECGPQELSDSVPQKALAVR